MENELDVIDVSIDIETYSLDIPNSAVISIAACTHDSFFEVYFERPEQVKLHRHFDMETIQWHRKIHPEWYSRATTKTLSGEGLFAHEALTRLHHWLRVIVCGDAQPAFQIWMKPPRFDAGILEHLAKQVKVELPWTFREERDMRTLAALAQSCNSFEYSLLPPKPDTAHDALVDAKHQLEIISRCRTILNC